MFPEDVADGSGSVCPDQREALKTKSLVGGGILPARHWLTDVVNLVSMFLAPGPERGEKSSSFVGVLTPLKPPPDPDGKDKTASDTFDYSLG